MGALYFVTPHDFVYDESIHNVYDVVEDGAWDVEKLLEILPEYIDVHILNNVKPPGVQGEIDKPYWMLETKGEFNVRSS